MIRNSNVIKNNKQDIVFQICDWKSYDIYTKKEEDDEINEEEDENKFKNKVKRLVIVGYGITSAGNSISIHVHGFEPYFYINIPDDWDDRVFNLFKKELLKNIPDYAHEGLESAKIVERKEFYGFTNNKLFKYGMFQFKNQSCYYAFLRVIKEQKIYLKRFDKEFDFSNKIYETKVNPLLRFYHNQNIEPAGWCQIDAKKYELVHDKSTRCQLEVKLNNKDIHRSNIKDIPKYLIASFDIECTSFDGNFPKATRKEDEMIQIGTTIYEYGTNKCLYQYIGNIVGDCPMCTFERHFPFDGERYRIGVG